MKEIKSYVNMLGLGLLACGTFLTLMGFRENPLLITIFGFMMFTFMPVIQIGADVLVCKTQKTKYRGMPLA